MKQTAYNDSMLEIAGLIDAHPADTPASLTTDLTHYEVQRYNYPFYTMAVQAV